MSLRYVDLFAGAGGLSLGLRRVGFERAFAVEQSPLAAQSYFSNLIDESPEAWLSHARLDPAAQLASGLAIAPTSRILARRSSPRRLVEKLGPVDLVAGGPPCQGFSLAGHRKHGDARNDLPWQFLEFVQILTPRAVLIENVPGIGMRFGQRHETSVLDQLLEALESTLPGYFARAFRVNAVRHGVAQIRPRIFIVGLRADIAGPGIFGFDPANLLETGSNDERLTAFSVLGDLHGSVYKYKSRSEYPPELEPAAQLRFEDRTAGPDPVGNPPITRPANHAEREHSPIVVRRFKFISALASQGVHPRVLALPKRVTGDELKDALVEATGSVRFPLRYRSETLAQTQMDLLAAIMELATKKHSQRVLARDRPAPTMLSLPDDHIHYAKPRTLTVREMARLQGFPDWFTFHGKATTGGQERRREVPQYTQVGNAVPPPVAAVVGAAIGRYLLDGRHSRRWAGAPGHRHGPPED